MIYFGLREYGLTFRLLYMSLFLFLCVCVDITYLLAIVGALVLFYCQGKVQKEAWSANVSHTG